VIKTMIVNESKVGSTVAMWTIFSGKKSPIDLLHAGDLKSEEIEVQQVIQLGYTNSSVLVRYWLKLRFDQEDYWIGSRSWLIATSAALMFLPDWICSPDPISQRPVGLLPVSWPAARVCRRHIKAAIKSIYRLQKVHAIRIDRLETPTRSFCDCALCDKEQEQKPALWRTSSLTSV